MPVSAEKHLIYIFEHLYLPGVLIPRNSSIEFGLSTLIAENQAFEPGKLPILLTKKQKTQAPVYAKIDDPLPVRRPPDGL